MAQDAALRSICVSHPSLIPCRVALDLLTNPAFMAAAIVGVCLLGVSKGGFLGLGVMALPLMSLFVPPLQAAAIILPTVIAQDTLTARDCDLQRPVLLINSRW